MTDDTTPSITCPVAQEENLNLLNPGTENGRLQRQERTHLARRLRRIKMGLPPQQTKAE